MANLSETLTARVRETETEIAILQARQGAVIAEKQAILTAPTVDAKVLTRLEGEEQKIPLSIASLEPRLALLATQVEEAERAEAGARIGDIEAEHKAIALTLQSQHAEWLAGSARLMTLVEQMQRSKEQLKLLHDEAAFLRDRHDTRGAFTHRALSLVPGRGATGGAISEKCFGSPRE